MNPWAAVDEINCRHCKDVGTMRVLSRHENFETLMRCDCEAGHESSWKLPQWIRDCEPLFERKACPLDWFKPVVKPNFADTEDGMKALKALVWERVQYWRQKVRIAESYWESKVGRAHE